MTITKTALLAGLSEIRVTSTARTHTSDANPATYEQCERLAAILTEIALDPDATRRFVAEMTAPPCGRVRGFLARGFMFAQENLVAAGKLDAVTRF